MREKLKDWYFDNLGDEREKRVKDVFEKWYKRNLTIKRGEGKNAEEIFGLPYTSSSDFAALWNCQGEAVYKDDNRYIFSYIAITNDFDIIVGLEDENEDIKELWIGCCIVCSTSYSWDEIYDAAEGKSLFSEELTRKDTARNAVVSFVEKNFGFNLEREYETGLIESVEECIEDYVERYNITFDEEGCICGHSKINTVDKARELLDFYYKLPNRSNKEFDTLDIALKLITEVAQQNTSD